MARFYRSGREADRFRRCGGSDANPEVVSAMNEADWDIASHSLKWIEHKDMTEAEERAAIAEAVRIHTEVTGQRPVGWYTGRTSEGSLRLVIEEGICG